MCFWGCSPSPTSGQNPHPLMVPALVRMGNRPSHQQLWGLPWWHRWPSKAQRDESEESALRPDLRVRLERRK